MTTSAQEKLESDVEVELGKCYAAALHPSGALPLRL